jgi:hypothetical protein
MLRDEGGALVFVLLLVCAATGCTTITTQHDPLYRAAPHDSKIQAEARNDTFGISSISIDVSQTCAGYQRACRNKRGSLATSRHDRAEGHSLLHRPRALRRVVRCELANAQMS